MNAWVMLTMIFINSNIQSCENPFCYQGIILTLIDIGITLLLGDHESICHSRTLQKNVRSQPLKTWMTILINFLFFPKQICFDIFESDTLYGRFEESRMEEGVKEEAVRHLRYLPSFNLSSCVYTSFTQSQIFCVN